MKKILSLCFLTLFTFAAFSQDYIKIGNIKYDAADYTGAAEDFLKATQQTPGKKVAWYNLAMAKSKLALYDEAIVNFSKALDIDPKYTDALFRRGFSNEDKGSSAEAILDYTKLIEMDPGYLEAYFERGYSNVSLAKYLDAITDYTSYINKGGKSTAEAYYERGLSKNRSADYPGALEDLKKAGDFGKKDKLVFYEIGYVHENMGEYVKAIQIYTKVIEMEAGYYDAWHGRGLSKIASNDFVGGCEDLYKAEELGSPTVYLDLMDYCESEE